MICPIQELIGQRFEKQEETEEIDIFCEDEEFD